MLFVYQHHFGFHQSGYVVGYVGFDVANRFLRVFERFEQQLEKYTRCNQTPNSLEFIRNIRVTLIFPILRKSKDS